VQERGEVQIMQDKDDTVLCLFLSVCFWIG